MDTSDFSPVPSHSTPKNGEISGEIFREKFKENGGGGKMAHFSEKNGEKSEIFSEKFEKISLKSESYSPSKREFNEILYKNIKRVTKFKCSPIKKCLFESSERVRCAQLFERIVRNPLIISKILSFLSNGDLYRLSMTSSNLKMAIVTNCRDARLRLRDFCEKNRDNKENYRITPPGSPSSEGKKEEEKRREGHVDSSYENSHFSDYLKMARRLTSRQSLTKCPRCKRPSVLERSLSQCQDHRRCGYVYCVKCMSFSVNLHTFYDKCGTTKLAQEQQHRNNESSNSMTNFSLFYSPQKKKKRVLEESSSVLSSSGYYSETSNSMTSMVQHHSTPLKKVRRSIPFNSVNYDVATTTTTELNKIRKEKDFSSSSLSLITLTDDVELLNQSPPRNNNNKSIGICCTRQSKKNLKRLTR